MPLSLNRPGSGGVADGPDKNYTHNQLVASATWNIVHNLNKKPSIVLVNNTDDMIYGEVRFIDNNNITVTFSSPESGKAYIN